MSSKDPWAELVEFDGLQPSQQPMGAGQIEEPAPDDLSGLVNIDAPADVPSSAPPPTLSAGGVDALRAAHPNLDFTDDGQVILQDAGGVAGQDTGIVGEQGGFHTERNPRMAGGNAAVNAMLKSGASKPEIFDYLTRRNPSWTQADLLSIGQQVDKIRQWQAENRGYKGDFYVDVEHTRIPNTAWQDFASSDVGTGAGSAADAATGFNTDSVIGVLGGDAEEARVNLDAAQAAHPKSALAGTLAGGVTGALTAEAALGKAGLKGAVKSSVADLAYGTEAGAGATDYAEDGTPATATDRLIGAGEGALASAAGGLGGRAVAGVGKRVASTARDPYVAAVNEAGIPTTVGQQYKGKIGGILKRTEDRVAGLPIIGDIINARRAEGIKKFNARAFDHALEPIGIKSGGRVAEDAVDFAQDQISEAYNKALGGKEVQADDVFVEDFTDAVTGVRSLPRVGEEVSDNIRVIVEPYMTAGNTLSGEAMQQISRELRDLKAGYVTDPLKKRIGTEIDQVENSIFGLFRRQAPEVMPAYNKAKAAQRRLYILADAVLKAKNQEGVFMPHQLGQADRAAIVKSSGKVSAARGRGEFHDLQRAAQEVLPSKVPDSGTAGRVILPAVALGLGGGSDASGMTNGTGTTLAAILSLAYSRAGQRLLTKPGRGIGGRAGKVLSSPRTQRALTRAGAASAVAATQQ